MAQSPGHKKWPNHKVMEETQRVRAQVIFNGETIANSSDVIKLVEDNYPPRFYFPKKDVRMDMVKDSEVPTECPFKGKGHYLMVDVKGKKLSEAAWSFDYTYDEHADLKDRIAFYQEKMDKVLVDNVELKAA
jgi:uncharacterized protein (DUF427 family)